MRVLDADVACVFFPFRSLYREFGLLLARAEGDRFDLEDALFTGRDLDGNRDRIEVSGAADLVGHRRFIGGVAFHFRRGSLLGEVDAVVVRVLFGAGVIGQVIRAAGCYRRRKECP